MTPPSRRTLLSLAIGATLLVGFVQIFTHNWYSTLFQDREVINTFLEDCRRRIPENAPVFIVGDYYAAKYATRFYPRPVRIGTLAEAKSNPVAWVVMYGETFMLVRARDLP